MTVIGLEQRNNGHAAVLGGAYDAKQIIAVDEDIDPTDMDQIICAVSSRCSPIENIDIPCNTCSTPLDPTQNPPGKSRARLDRT